MAAAENPPENNQDATAAANGGPLSNGASNSTGDNSATQAALRHNTGISIEWTPDEQLILEDLLNKYASESIIVRYAKIAMQLKDKTVRDVALRCRWMNKKENGKRRKEDHSARKNKDRKEKGGDSSAKSSSHLTTRSNGPSYTPPVIPMDNDDGISYKAIGGATGELLEQNSQILSQISSNFASFQVHDNINLLSKTRDNILSILNDLKDVPEIMKQMPPLPVKMNEELAKSILHPTSHQMKS
ncbi:hypothetical protein K2173_000613 [Erythroxylum novogranatense]|uniref:Myb-like domain-containing protein n=1 Tax=Erythroxylum novogranatense TaxID=1862640 RepID=A0AAV8S842_9ROSI|nr:hypothetical protein K2173_000613 [Erythroxylum novogranatense]